MVRAGKAAFGGTEGKARAFLPNVIDAVEKRSKKAARDCYLR
jgi:hypothetical protein